MKNFFLLLSFLIVCFIVHAQQILDKTTIMYSGIEFPAIKDLKNCLLPFKAGNIVIKKVALENRTGQSFYLSVDNNKTEIQYTTEQSLENAIYTYLDLLEFRWYGPGDNWFVKPKQIKNLKLKGQWYEPSFRNRNFFGTGGLDFGKIQSYDPQNNYKEKWYTWKRRNRFSADFKGVGHAGEAFYIQNKTVLDKHPEWFINEHGKKAGRFKIDNAAAVGTYKKWIKSVYDNSKTDFIILGVDPEDGRGGADDPLPTGMKGIKNHADKWWWLANEVAKDYDESNKRVVVSMYAYGDGAYNALIPSFTLRKNVYPVIIPYAFQKAYLPNEMVAKWGATISGKMGLYDYWNITQWSSGLPQFNIYTIPEKLNFWHKNKVDGIYLETTDAAGPMGHSLWIAAQLEWDLNKDFEKLYTQYLNDCFGNAALAMRTMFDRWSKNYQGAADVAFSLQDLNNASNAVKKGSSEWKRINELKAYVHFMKLYYEHDGTQKSKDHIFNYLYSIHHLMMVQTAAFIGQNYIPPFDKGNIVPDTKGVKLITEKEIENQFQYDLKSSTSKLYTLENFIFDYDKVRYTTPIPINAWRFGGFQCFFYFKAPFSGIISMDAGAEVTTPLKVYTDNEKIVDESVGNNNYDYKEKLLGREWSLKKFKLSIVKGKTYYISTNYGFSRVKINTPGIVLFKQPGQQDFDNYQYPIQYFYVPKGTKEIVFYDAEPEGTTGRGFLINPDNIPVKRLETGAKNIYKVVVAPRYRGKIWQADFAHPTWSFKNIPNIVSLQNFIYNE